MPPGRGRARLVCWLSLLGLLVWVLRTLHRSSRDRPGRGDHARHRVPSHIYRRPDPLIYDQYYLQSLGLAVTWDNPDIHLERADMPGVHVDSHTLAPDTEYNVVARIWNGSNYAPAVDMPVRFFYLEFGIGMIAHPIGQTLVDLPVRGASGCPAFASVPWRTPTTPGHYCVQVEFVWLDDENPHNNLGQHNTDVQALNSPRAAFGFAVRNDGARPQALQFEIDAFRIPPLEPCDRDRAQDRVRDRHDPKHHSIPAGWDVRIDPPRLRLAPGEQTNVSLEVDAPIGFSGRQAFNVNAFEHGSLTGGVTFYAEGSADA